jgi:hypothetical protein
MQALPVHVLVRQLRNTPRSSSEKSSVLQWSYATARSSSLAPVSELPPREQLTNKIGTEVVLTIVFARACVPLLRSIEPHRRSIYRTSRARVSTLAQKNERSIVKLKLLLASDHTAIGIPRRFRMRPIHHVASSKCLIANWRTWNGYSTMPEMQTSPSRSRLRL